METNAPTPPKLNWAEQQKLDGLHGARRWSRIGACVLYAGSAAFFLQTSEINVDLGGTDLSNFICFAGLAIIGTREVLIAQNVTDEINSLMEGAKSK